MVSVYNDAHYLAAYKQKQKVWWFFIGVTLAYLVCCIALLIYHISLPYADARLELPKWCVYILTVVYIFFAYPYIAIKYSRVRKYFAILSLFSSGLKQEENNYFYCFDKKTLQKDNIDVESCVFETWSKKKCEWQEREAYFDMEQPRPPFESGDYVRYIVQSNFVIEYEILQKKVLEFEEIDEYGEQDLEEVEDLESDSVEND